MDEARLERIFRHVLSLSLATPLVLSLGACGGRAALVEGADGGPDPRPCATESCLDAAHADSSPPGPRADAAPPDPTFDASPPVLYPDPDASPLPFDAAPPPSDGNPCNPQPVGCGAVGVLASCLGLSVPQTGMNGMVTDEQCETYCGPGVVDAGGMSGACVYWAGTTVGEIFISCGLGCPGGRRPRRWQRSRVSRHDPPLGRYFARQAELEAVSIDAFRILQAELRAHGAPQHLIAAAARAERDEVRHTRMAIALARRFGTRVRPPRVISRRQAARHIRTVEAIAVENAVEGCVRETFGAVAALAQARDAADEHIRSTMEQIVPDETRHAALGWAVHAWTSTKLDAAAMARVDRARRAAVADMHDRAALEPHPSLCAVAGVPSKERMMAMVGALEQTLWNAATA
jgi:hypothetical protein